MFFTNQSCFSHLTLGARFPPNKASHFQRMESKALESRSSYHVSCQRGTEGLLWSQYITQLLLHCGSWNKKTHRCCYRCPLQQAVHEQTWDSYSASQQTGPGSFQNDLLSRFSIIKLGSCLGLPPCCLLSPARTQSKEGPPVGTAGITFPTGQTGAWTTWLHFGPKSNLWSFTGNADPAGQWIWSFI